VVGHGTEIGLEAGRKHQPQYHITFSILAAENRAYRVGTVPYKLCAGTLIDPWMVPPYIPTSATRSAICLYSLWVEYPPHGRSSTSTRSFPTLVPSRNHWRSSVREIDAGKVFLGEGWAACHGNSGFVFESFEAVGAVSAMARWGEVSFLRKWS